MSLITCCTCQKSFSNDEISKHLSSTRHKQTKYDPLGEIIECENCDDDNIHQLQILRYGLSDMALLCQLCLNKEEKASIQYSLSNGSFFKKIDQYFKFRDIECSLCGNDSYLLVGSDAGKQYIVCAKCKPLFVEENPKVDLVSERDDIFLTVLLGIAEAKLKGPDKFKGRKRKAMKGGKKRRVNPLKEKEAQERRDHYFNKLRELKEIRSGTTVKAVGTVNTQTSKGKNPKGPNGSKPSSKNNSKPNSARQSRSSTPVSQTNGLKNKTNGTKSNGPKDGNSANIKTNGISGNTGNRSKGSSAASKGSSDAPKGGSSSKSRTAPSKSAPKSSLKSNESSSKSNELKVKSQKKALAKEPEKGRDHAAKTAKQASNRTLNPKKTSPNDKKDNKKKADKVPDKQGNKEKRAKQQDNENKNADIPQKLPNGLVEYSVSKEPKLSYESMDVYLKEMSYNLFLEEKLSMASSQNQFIEPGEFVLSWFSDQDKKDKRYHIEIELKQEFKDKFLSKKIQKFRKSPFSVDQTIFLVCNSIVPWYGKIILSETVKKGRLKEVLELIVEQYPWNYQPLPLNINIKHLSLLPASIPISRVFLAMDRVENPRFIKMLLGKEPIRQIHFNNYVKLSDESKFNQSQKIALQSVLNNSITVLQGPPGTGKTSTIHEIILQLLNNLNTYPVLVVAASNIAIDNIAEKLMPTHERSLLRIVANEKELDYNRSHSLSSICLHPKIDQMLPLSMKETLAKLKTFRASEVSVNQYKKVQSKKIELSNILISQARVIFTTSVVAGGNQLKPVKKFPVVIMDEATQSSEPTTLIPLSMPGVDKFVFVGDQKQLSSFTQVPNLSLSLFERVLLNGTYKTPHMLDMQYRMHPQISEFSRNKFYNGLLKDGITAEQRTIELIKNPVLFWDTRGQAQEERVRIRMREDNGYTYSNPGEINYIIEVLQDLIFAKKIEKANIGIITPYRGQRDLISKTLSENDLINPEKDEIKIEVDRDDIYNESKPVTIHTVSDIMIASIDAFQGREKDFIIFSCVRSNDSNKIGFLNDERRLNVALTRARYGLILIGDYKCLRNDALWNEYLQHLKDKGCVNDNNKIDY